MATRVYKVQLTHKVNPGQADVYLNLRGEATGGLGGALHFRRVRFGGEEAAGMGLVRLSRLARELGVVAEGVPREELADLVAAAEADAEVLERRVRLTEEGAAALERSGWGVAPGYTRADLEAMSVEEVRELAEGLEVEGTGSGGRVVKEDLIRELVGEEAEAAGGAPPDTTSGGEDPVGDDGKDGE